MTNRNCQLKKNRRLLGVLLLFLLSNCISDVVINENDLKQLLVLNCFLNPAQDTVVVHLSWTKPIQTIQTFKLEKEAHVRLFEEGQLVGAFIWKDSSAYMLPFQVSPGKLYKLEASSGRHAVWAETRVPGLVNATIEKAIPENYMDPFQISLVDMRDEVNYYWISANGYTGSYDDQHVDIACLIYSNNEHVDDFNQVISQNSIYHFEHDYYMRLSDNEMDTEPVHIEFSPQCIGYPIKVFLLSVDAPLDKYMKSSLLLHNMNLYAEDMPVIYAPFPIYTNIHGGTGIFGSYISVSKEFYNK